MTHSNERKPPLLNSVLAFLKSEKIDIEYVDNLFGAFDLLTDWLVLNAANKELGRQVLVAAGFINELAGQRKDENDHILASELFPILIANGGGPVRELSHYLNRDALQQLVAAYSRYVVHLGGMR